MAKVKAKTKKRSKAGQPTKYKPEYAKQTKKLCLVGMIDTQLADFFEVSEATISNWKLNHPKFLEAIKEGKSVADTQVEKSLFDRAMGYSHPEEKVFCNMGDITTHETTKHYPPEVAAGIFWLKNRKSKEWREKHEIELTNVNPVEMNKEDQGTL